MKQPLRTAAVYWMTVLSALLLSACSQIGQPPAPTEPTIVSDWNTHQAELKAIEQYQVSGKLGYIDPEQRQSLNFTWSKSPEKSELSLYSFLGSKVFTLTLTPRYARIETADGDVFSHLDAEYLIKNLTGFELPIGHFENWMIGLPGENDPFTLDGFNRLQSTQTLSGDALWQVEYTSYSTTEQYPLPKNFKLSHQQTKLIVSISNWQIN